MSKKMPLKRFLDAIKEDQESMAAHRAAAQPVEGPREPMCAMPNENQQPCALTQSGRWCYIHHCYPETCKKMGLGGSAPVEGVERVTDDAPARVEPACYHRPQAFPYCTKCGEKASCLWSAAQPAKHTDDRTAETTPEELTQFLSMSNEELLRWMLDSPMDDVFRTVKLARARAETRIEVLEAALRRYPILLGQAEARVKALEDAINSADATLCDCRYTKRVKDCNCDIHAAHGILRAALVAPSGEKEEICRE